MDDPASSSAGSPSIAIRRWIGMAIVLLALVFVGRELTASGLFGLEAWRSPRVWLATAGLAVGYALAGLLLASAWLTILNAGARHPIGWRGGVGVYARTQVLKYLPSNLVHLAGRHVGLDASGVPHRTIVAAALGEHVLLVGSASTLAVLLAPGALHALVGRVGGRRLIEGEAWPVFGLVALGIVGLAAWLASGWLRARVSRIGSLVRKPGMASAFARASSTYLLFFLSTGLIGVLLAALVSGCRPGTMLMPFTGAFAIAWVAGFIVPGAPGGIGVREAALVVVLSPHVAPDVAGFVAIAYRVVTLLGDVLLAGLGLLLSPAERRREGTV